MKRPSERVGERYGKLVILRFSHRRPTSGNYYFVCQCDCGNIKTIEFGGLRRGVVTTCGCGRKDKADANMVGKRFGRFVILRRLDQTAEHGEFIFECKCDCGNTFHAITSKIRRGRISSCGCKRRNRFMIDDGGNLRKTSDLDRVIRQSFTMSKSGARKRNIPYELSLTEFSKIIKQPCNYCGHTDSKTSRWTGKRYKLNGIDRIDSGKGYSTKNSVPSCIQCNRAKLDYSAQAFSNWVLRVYNHLSLHQI